MSVISVENISKKYILSHQSQDGYGTLRDVIAERFRNAGRRILHPFSNSTTPQLHSSTREEFWALKDVSFEIKQGDRVGIIGRNGAGKSTLLKILSRITEPTTGKIRIKGRVASLLEVGTGFHPELTGRENIFLNGAILGMSKAEIAKKFDEIVAFSEIEKFLDTPVKRYSSGMYVRLAFAVAAHLEPEILIVDEVLAVGDTQFQKKCLGKMDEVGKQGRTVLFVSHNLGAVQSLCSRAILINKGNVLKNSDTKSVIESYLSNLSDQMVPRTDLVAIPRKAGAAGNIRFTKCFILNSEGKITTKLMYGEPLKVFLEACSYSSYQDLSFVVGVDSASGVRIFTSESDDYGVVYSATADATLEIIVSFENLILTPGHYDLFISIRSGRVALDTLINIVRFEVTTLAYNNRKPHSGTFGLVTVLAEWSQKSQEIRR